MAKMSKYKQLIGKVINDVMVIDYERQERVSKKSGKTYKVTRLYVTADGENMLEIGTASFNKMSFLKRLAKITTKWIYKEQEKQVDEPAMHYPAIINEKPISADIIKKHVNKLENILCYKELKQEFRKLASIYHPDKGGNAQAFAHLAEIYSISEEVLRTTRDRKAKLDIERYEKLVKMLINCKKMQRGYGF